MVPHRNHHQEKSNNDSNNINIVQLEGQLENVERCLANMLQVIVAPPPSTPVTEDVTTSATTATSVSNTISNESMKNNTTENNATNNTKLPETTSINNTPTSESNPSSSGPTTTIQPTITTTVIPNPNPKKESKFMEQTIIAPPELFHLVPSLGRIRIIGKSTNTVIRRKRIDPSIEQEEKDDEKKQDIHVNTNDDGEDDEQKSDKNVDADITVTTWQSIYKLRKDWFEKFDVVVGDEAHLFKAKSLTKVMEKTPGAKYRYGFTGTLDGTETHKLVLEGLFGKVYEVTKTAKLIEEKTLADFNIKAITLGYPQEIRKQNKGDDYQTEIDWIVRNDARNKFIKNLAHSLKGNTLILFQFVEKHGKVLHPMLESDKHQVHFVHGGVTADDREEIRHITEQTHNNIILASYGTFSTGINIKKLDNIIFASPSKSKIRNLQSIGRVLRKGNGKTKATLYDIVDDLQYKSHQNFAVKHFMERVNIYTEEGFDFKIYNVDIGE